MYMYSNNIVYTDLQIVLIELCVHSSTVHVHVCIQRYRLHEFKWHGSDPSDPGRFIPGKSQFTQLCHVPSQFYCNVKDVRTNDDTLITVKLMLFYDMTDVETMVRNDDTKTNVYSKFNV